MFVAAGATVVVVVVLLLLIFSVADLAVAAVILYKVAVFLVAPLTKKCFRPRLFLGCSRVCVFFF